MPTWVCSHEIPIEHWCWPTKHQWRGNFPKGMLGVTMFAKAKLQLEFVRWTGPRCAAVTDIQGDTPGPKKNGFLHGKTGPVLWMDQVSWDVSCRLHWASSISQLIHVLFGATIQWRSGIGSPRVWNLAGSYLNRTQMSFVQQVLVVFRQKPLTISINLPILGDVLLAICLAKSWKIRISHWQNWQMALAQTCWPLLFHSLMPNRNVATQHRYRALEILTRFLMPCECVTWQQGPDVGTRAE